MAVLEFLLERHGNVVTLDELLDVVWRGQVVEPASVQKHIARLRKALQDDPRVPTYIETIKKRGYRAIGPLRRAEPFREHPALESRALATRSIAVLPLANLSPDPENAYFAAGIHEELLTRLAKIRALKVISRTSVLEYLNSPRNIRAIAEQLGVTTILEGTVRRAQDTVRINVQLIDAYRDEHLWGATYDRELSAHDVFAIQIDIANAIIGALQAVLTPPEIGHINQVPTESTRAYDFYLIGNEYFRKPDDPHTLPLAQQMYERAIVEDPEFATLYAALSHVHSRSYNSGLDRTNARLMQAKDAFEQAFNLVPDLPEAHLAAGEYYYRALSDHDRALQQFAIAEQGMPGSAELADLRAAVYRRLGDWQQALAQNALAMELDPRNAQHIFQYAHTLTCLRNYDEAEPYYRRALELSPDHPFANTLDRISLFRDGDTDSQTEDADLDWLRYLYRRDYDGGLAYLDGLKAEAVASIFSYIPKAALHGLMFKLAGKPELAEPHYQSAFEHIKKAQAASDKDALLHVALGEALAGLGERKLAVRAARRAMALLPTSTDAVIGAFVRMDAVIRVFLIAGEYEAAIQELDAYLAAPGTWSIEGLLPDPRLDPIREDSRFCALVKKYKRR